MPAIISGRLKNREKSGFERTPPTHAAAIAANLLNIPTHGLVAIYDPTCGAGDLLAPYQHLRNAHLAGVEISAERVTLARHALPAAQILESDVAAVVVPRASMSLVVANPPYLQGTLRRLEIEIIKDAGEALVTSGVLVAVLPARQWDGFMASHWLRHYDDVRCWRFPSGASDDEHAFERFTQIVVAGVRRAAPRTEIDPTEKHRLRGLRYYPDRVATPRGSWEGASEPPILPTAPIAHPYRVPVVTTIPTIALRRADNVQILRALAASGAHTTPEWAAATTWPETAAVDRPVMDYTGEAHVAADVLTGLLDGIPFIAPDGVRYLLTTFVAQEWVEYELNDDERDDERQRGTINVRVEQLEDKAILGVLNLATGDVRYYQKDEVFTFLKHGGWLPTLAAACRARRSPIYQLDPADWQLRVAAQVGTDKQLHSAPFPGLSVAQQHRAYALWASVATLGRAAIQGEPGTGKTHMLTLLMAQAAYRWQQRDSAAFRSERQPGWIRRLKKAWKANPLTSGAAPRALPLLIAMPLRTRKGFRRDCSAAWPEAEFMVINDHTDIRRWIARCSVSDAPAVIAICSLSQTKDFGNEWVPAAIVQQKTRLAPDLSDSAQARGTPVSIGTMLLGYADRDTGEIVRHETTTTTFVCPDCGAQVTDVPLHNTEDEDTYEPVTSATYFTVKRRWCRHCGGALNAKDRISARWRHWPHVPFATWSRGVEQPTCSTHAQRIVAADGTRGPLAPDSFSPFDYLYHFYRGCVGITIVDESHNLAGRDSHLARAGHLAMRAAQARVLSSGTHFAGTIDKFYYYWLRYNPRFWRKLGLGWNYMPAAIERYGVVQHWVREVETNAKRGGRGQTELREATIPAPGISAKLLPHLLHELVFLTVLDVGAHMPPRIEIPELVPMRDPALSDSVSAARDAVTAAAAQQQNQAHALRATIADPAVDDETIRDAEASEEAAATRFADATAALRTTEAWATARDLNHHYQQLADMLDATAQSKSPGGTAARLAKGTVPRWFAALPCVTPPFTVQYRTRGDWGDIESTHTLLTTPVLAYDHVYPLEDRVRTIIDRERAEGRRVMLYFEQQNRSMAQRLTWLLQPHAPWTLPDNVKAENREDAIRQAVADGREVTIVPFLRVSEGLNLQDCLDTIVWVELPKNLFTLDQASRRIWRLNKVESVRLYYVVYAGTAGHRKLRKLASQSGAAALFSGNTPDGQLVRSVGAHKTTLAQISAGLKDEQDELRAAFVRRGDELAAALKTGRQWLGITDTLPERLRALHATARELIFTPLAVPHAAPLDDSTVCAPPPVVSTEPPPAPAQPPLPPRQPVAAPTRIRREPVATGALQLTLW